MKKLIATITLLFSSSAFASICEKHPILDELEYSPIIAYIGLFLGFMGLVTIILAFTRKNEITAFKQLKNILLGAVLIGIPYYGYYDLSENYGFTNENFFKYEGKVMDCMGIQKYIPDGIKNKFNN